jgi:hypothetical protein
VNSEKWGTVEKLVIAPENFKNLSIVVWVYQELNLGWVFSYEIFYASMNVVSLQL